MIGAIKKTDKEIIREQSQIILNKTKQIAELEKENAELKEKLNIRSCQNCKHYNKSCPNDGSCKHYSKWEGCENPQLTKAKEIIKGLKVHLDLSDCVNNDYRLQLLKQAEQFLNSEVEK